MPGVPSVDCTGALPAYASAPAVRRFFAATPEYERVDFLGVVEGRRVRQAGVRKIDAVRTGVLRNQPEHASLVLLTRETAQPRPRAPGLVRPVERAALCVLRLACAPIDDSSEEQILAEPRVIEGGTLRH